MEVKKVIVDNSVYNFIVDNDDFEIDSYNLFLEDTVDLTDMIVDLRTIIEGSECNEQYT